MIYEEEITQKISKLRKTLLRSKWRCKHKYDAYREAERIYNIALDELGKERDRFHQLDIQLAELDGRLQIITDEKIKAKKEEDKLLLTPEQARSLYEKLSKIMEEK